METFSRFVLSEDGTVRTIKMPKEQALKEIDKILEEDQEFLEIWRRCTLVDAPRISTIPMNKFNRGGA